MSHYNYPTIHPKTRQVEIADWLDGYFGGRRYGVRFPSDGEIFPAETVISATNWRYVSAGVNRGAWAHAKYGTVSQMNNGEWEAYGWYKADVSSTLPQRHATPEQAMRWLEDNYGEV